MGCVTVRSEHETPDKIGYEKLFRRTTCPTEYFRCPRPSPTSNTGEYRRGVLFTSARRCIASCWLPCPLDTNPHGSRCHLSPQRRISHLQTRYVSTPSLWPIPAVSAPFDALGASVSSLERSRLAKGLSFHSLDRSCRLHVVLCHQGIYASSFLRLGPHRCLVVVNFLHADLRRPLKP
ncbi:hypothetical protein SCLCIDRAFT_769294 [Scleroderma citrinum Foug A]|uniref:Uncharacterized protein n=1 Tax=Scleroderma citrinum Foug A TaxID=1036808 RepID=A0A0C3DR72_9AGAM|nr:hypothetical protein SCLCIDRAFT_769294 [Scleroderma citrinum Foug A]